MIFHEQIKLKKNRNIIHTNNNNDNIKDNIEIKADLLTSKNIYRQIGNESEFHI